MSTVSRRYLNSFDLCFRSHLLASRDLLRPVLGTPQRGNRWALQSMPGADRRRETEALLEVRQSLTYLGEFAFFPRGLLVGVGSASKAQSTPNG